MSNNLQQAPELIANGVKDQHPYNWGKAIRPHELEAAIANCLGDRDFVAYKVMMFYTGNAEGFRVAEKTICERCNISDRAYSTARKKLANMNWITDVKGNSITVNYNKIFSDYKKKIAAKGDELTSSPKQKSFQEGMNSLHPDEMNSLHPQGGTYFTPTGGSEFTHNNISNNITSYYKEENNSKVEEKSNSVVAANAAPTPLDFSSTATASNEAVRAVLEQRKKEKEEKKRLEEQYHAEVSVLNDKYMELHQQFRTALGDGYSENETFIKRKNEIHEQLEELKVKYNMKLY